MSVTLRDLHTHAMQGLRVGGLTQRVRAGPILPSNVWLPASGQMRCRSGTEVQLQPHSQMFQGGAPCTVQQRCQCCLAPQFANTAMRVWAHLGVLGAAWRDTSPCAPAGTLRARHRARIQLVNVSRAPSRCFASLSQHPWWAGRLQSPSPPGVYSVVCSTQLHADIIRVAVCRSHPAPRTCNRVGHM